jgi:hypothetical protein
MLKKLKAVYLREFIDFFCVFMGCAYYSTESKHFCQRKSQIFLTVRNGTLNVIFLGNNCSSNSIYYNIRHYWKYVSCG